MKTYCIFDTETTGFPNFKAPPGDASQAYLVQFAARLVREDRRVLQTAAFIVECPVAIPAVAAAVHGVTDDMAFTYGFAPAAIARVFQRLLDQADMVVAHNMKFDHMIMRANSMRYMKDEVRWPTTFCTMEQSKEICRVPPTQKMVAAGRTGFKPPSLAEAYRHATGKELSGAHDALVDTLACEDVFFFLLEKGLVK